MAKGVDREMETRSLLSNSEGDIRHNLDGNKSNPGKDFVRNQ